MNERTRKVAATCFASGCATFLVLCIAVPTIGVGWALLVSVVIGAPIGYFGYRFKDVLRAIPRAARQTIPIVGIVLRAVCIDAPLDIWRAFREFTRVPRPFFWPHLLFGSALAAIATSLDVPVQHLFTQYARFSIYLFCFLTLGVIGYPLAIIAVSARESSCKRWMTASAAANISISDPLLILRSVSYPVMLRFYADALWNVVYGVGFAIYAICGLLPRTIFRFARQLFLLIHSDERTICAVDGPLGGIITYAVLRIHHGSELAALPTPTLFGLVILGGAVAALVGMTNLEIISIRWLKLLPARARK